jgi:hypothetical protein
MTPYVGEEDTLETPVSLPPKEDVIPSGFSVASTLRPTSAVRYNAKLLK